MLLRQTLFLPDTSCSVGTKKGSETEFSWASKRVCSTTTLPTVSVSVEKNFLMQVRIGYKSGYISYSQSTPRMKQVCLYYIKSY